MRLLFAYIDPGAGSLVIQAIIAGVVSIPFFFRNAIRSTIGRFRHKPASDDAVSESVTHEDTGASPTHPE
jgi:hypothetical protein